MRTRGGSSWSLQEVAGALVLNDLPTPRTRIIAISISNIDKFQLVQSSSWIYGLYRTGVNRQFYTCINHLFTLSITIVSNSITMEHPDSSIDIDSVLSASSSSSSTVLLTGGTKPIRTVALALVGLLTIFDDHCYKFGTVAKCW